MTRASSAPRDREPASRVTDVIARSVSDEAIQVCFRGATLDCFASLAMTVSLFEIGSQCQRASSVPRAHKKRKRPWGAGVFASQLGGSWGSSHYPRGLWGAGKEPREFVKLVKLLSERCCCPN